MGGPGIVASANDLEQGPPLTGNHDEHYFEMRNVPRSEYHDRVVKPKLMHRPWLDVLDQFLNPNQIGFPVEQDHRMRHFDIKVIHISKFGKISSITKYITPEQFGDVISEDKEWSGILIIAKDLSRAMIDALGMKYKLEPEFFASRLAGTEPFITGDLGNPNRTSPWPSAKLFARLS